MNIKKAMKDLFTWLTTGGGIALLLRYLVPLITKLRQRHYQQLTNREIKQREALQAAMGEIMTQTRADRFLIMKAHNGGGRIKAGEQIYFSIIQEYPPTNVSPIKDKYQKVEASDTYVKMLIELIEHKQLDLKTEDIEDSIHRISYQKEGIQCARLFYLTSGKSIYYASASSTSDSMNSLEEQAVFDLNISKIRSIYKNYE